MQAELQQVKGELASRQSDANAITKKCKGLESKLSALQQATAKQEAATKQEVHETMLSAASKVHELEDQNEKLSTDLQKAKKALATASRKALRQRTH